MNSLEQNQPFSVFFGSSRVFYKPIKLGITDFLIKILGFLVVSGMALPISLCIFAIESLGNLLFSAIFSNRPVITGEKFATKLATLHT